MSKYKGSIVFRSKAGLFVFKLTRSLALLSLFLGIVSCYPLYSQYNDNVSVIPQVAPIIFFVAIWLLLRAAVRRRIKKYMIIEAERQGLTLRQYETKMVKEKSRTRFFAVGKATSPQAGSRAEQALADFRRTRKHRLKEVPNIWRSDGSEELRKSSFKMLRAAQEQGQAIVNETSRDYAVKEYGALNGLAVHDVKKLLDQGDGPVTRDVNDIYESVHYEYKAYFTNKDSPSLKTMLNPLESDNHHFVQGVDGSFETVYHTR